MELVMIVLFVIQGVLCLLLLLERHHLLNKIEDLENECDLLSLEMDEISNNQNNTGD